MERARRERLNHLMGMVAGGDDAALFALWCEFAPELRTVMVGLARRRGHRFLPADAIDDLAGEAWLALRALAPAWRSDGALPWVWGQARLLAMVDRVVPRPTLPFPEEESEEVSRGELFCGDDPPPTATLQALAAGNGWYALLQEALDRALSRANQDLLLAYRMQQLSHDPSPATTLGAMFGLSPPNVRQRVARARKRTLAVITAEPRFAPLADLPLFVVRAA